MTIARSILRIFSRSAPPPASTPSGAGPLAFPAVAALLLLLAAPPPALLAQSGQSDGERTDETTLRPLDHDIYDLWRVIGERALSHDGEWVLYTLELEDGDGTLVLRHADSGREHEIARAEGARFAPGSGHAVFRIRPALDDRRQARREGVPSAEQPRDTLGVAALADGSVERIAHLRSLRLAEEGAPWLAVHLHPEQPEEEGEEEAPQGRSGDESGPLLLRNLETGEEHRFDGVEDYALSEAGSLLLFTTVEGDEEGDEEGEGRSTVHAVRTAAAGEVMDLHSAEGSHAGLTVADDGARVAFLFRSEEDREAETPNRRATAFELHYWDGDGESRVVAREGSAGIPDGWGLSEHGSLSFSDEGGRLFFGTAPRPDPVEEPDHDRLPEDEVGVEVWHWQEPTLMSVQTRQADQERRRTYEAVLHLDSDRIVQLADEEMPQVSVARDGDGEVALGMSDLPYRRLVDWDSPRYRDAYLVDVESGERERIVERTQGFPSLSPEARWVSWYEPTEQAWFTHEVATGERVRASEAIPHPVFNEDHDSPAPAGSYGSPGWTEGDHRFLVYDRYDLWALDPTSEAGPVNVTGGAGRDWDVRFRAIRLDGDADAFPRDGELLFSAFHEGTREAGFYQGRMEGNREPERLLFSDHRYSTPVQARDGERILLTRESFREFPDLWTAGPELDAMERVSRANPQQDEYLWGTNELMRWTSGDGHALEGILVKPDDFDPEREYPLMVYFYERDSHNLNMHWTPVPHRSRINPAFYASRGYLVFIPDIVYRDGYPGESAYNSVVPGVVSLLERGYVDRDRIALQGHSWAGYQIAFIVTRSRDLFAAAAPGAPVANMTSAYGGIRRETGLVRQFQYERTQSRLGGSLWDVPIRYFENSPLFWVDKIETPLLIMHNDEDGHVPWQQGKELFTALRRLAKPAWLINYTGEPHWPTTYVNRRDWNIRMQQFFDHFLLDEPMPVWMAEGIPAVLQGTTLGLELVEEEPPATEPEQGGSR